MQCILKEENEKLARTHWHTTHLPHFAISGWAGVKEQVRYTWRQYAM